MPPVPAWELWLLCAELFCEELFCDDEFCDELFVVVDELLCAELFCEELFCDDELLAVELFWAEELAPPQNEVPVIVVPFVLEYKSGFVGRSWALISSAI